MNLTEYYAPLLLSVDNEDSVTALLTEFKTAVELSVLANGSATVKGYARTNQKVRAIIRLRELAKTAGVSNLGLLRLCRIVIDYGLTLD